MKEVSDDMLTKNKKGNFQTEIINLDEIVPQDHILRIIEKEFDFSFIYDELKDKYSSTMGRTCEDIIRMFKYLEISKIEKLDISDKIKYEINDFLDRYYDKYTGLYLKSKDFIKNLNKLDRE